MQNSRLTILRVTVKLMALFALGLFLWVLFGSVPGSGPETVQVTRIDISDMQPGEHRLLEWKKKPLYIVYRKPEWESALQNAPAATLRDPDSENSEQPENAGNALRSPATGFFVTLGLGTGSGCALVFTPPPESNLAGAANIKSGFADGCDQSRYDLAGRVYADQQARRNTVVPNWQLIGQEVVISD